MVFKIYILSLFLFFSVLYGNENFLNEKENYDEKKLKAELETNPSNANVLSRLAWVHEKRKDYRGALKMLRRCIELEPEESFHYIRLARAYEKIGRVDLSWEVLADAELDFRNNQYICSGLGGLEYKKGNFRKSISYYQKALSIGAQKNEAFYYQGIAKSYRELGEYEKSRVFFRKALQIEKDFWIYYEYSKLLSLLKEYESALWAVSKAELLLQGKEDSVKEILIRKKASIYYAYGMSMKNKGEKEKAREIWIKLIKDKELSQTSFGEKAEFWVKRL
jgi:tetratricopeptide (TPR) repeat protein